MINHRHRQGLSMPISSHYWVRKFRRSSHRDRFFRLPTVLAQNDIFLRRLYSAVSFYLDDHPYPSTPEDFLRRTHEIKQNVRDLNLSPEQNQFLQQLKTETGVSLVNLSTKILDFTLCSLSLIGRSLARLSYHCTRWWLSL